MGWDEGERESMGGSGGEADGLGVVRVGERVRVRVGWDEGERESMGGSGGEADGLGVVRVG